MEMPLLVNTKYHCHVNECFLGSHSQQLMRMVFGNRERSLSHLDIKMKILISFVVCPDATVL